MFLKRQTKYRPSRITIIYESSTILKKNSCDWISYSSEATISTKKTVVIKNMREEA